MHGAHLTKAQSKRQSNIALSSGEAKFYATVSATSEAMGLKAMLQDYQAPLDPWLFVDASAAIGVAQRSGLGEIRHLDTGTLWLQQAVKEGRVTLRKMPGSENPADLGTKPLGKASIMKILQMLGFVVMEGKSRLAMTATV